MDTFIQLSVDALTLGSVYALIALGYTMVYGVLKLLNFAHGDVYMIGAYVGFFVLNALGSPLAPVMPIVPLILFDEQRTQEVARRLFDAGVYVVPIVYPMVARGRARIRMMISAAHTPDDLHFAAQAIATAIGATA